MEELDAQECKELLKTTHLGRLGYSTAEGQRIAPLNFITTDDYLIFRTSAYNEVARFARQRAVAFEVDQIDEFLQAGWSVLVLGIADDVPQDVVTSLELSERPDPWPEGTRSLFLRIALSRVTGRRVHPA
jgi:nitroimidazol reductase NimA-like FMN-containing flavoprotein (pyridoxamine 5'-phosphate oxidase superfamily)